MQQENALKPIFWSIIFFRISNQNGSFRLFSAILHSVIIIKTQKISIKYLKKKTFQLKFRLRATSLYRPDNVAIKKLNQRTPTHKSSWIIRNWIRPIKNLSQAKDLSGKELKTNNWVFWDSTMGNTLNC